jgi:hypothetical protein
LQEETLPVLEVVFPAGQNVQVPGPEEAVHPEAKDPASQIAQDFEQETDPGESVYLPFGHV